MFTPNKMKSVHWPFDGCVVTFHRARTHCAQTPRCCTKCNRLPINGQCTNQHRPLVALPNATDYPQRPVNQSYFFILLSLATGNMYLWTVNQTFFHKLLSLSSLLLHQFRRTASHDRGTNYPKSLQSSEPSGSGTLNTTIPLKPSTT